MLTHYLFYQKLLKNPCLVCLISSEKNIYTLEKQNEIEKLSKLSEVTLKKRKNIDRWYEINLFSF